MGKLPSSLLFSSNQTLAYDMDLRYCISPLFPGPFLWERLVFGTFVCKTSNNVPKISVWVVFFCVCVVSDLQDHVV